eukprot:scaffold22638_cov138-Cylindrotheca_fusiformis.AAC.12
MIGGGALGQQAATAVRHVAAQNGVWSLGNFGGMPPKSAMMYHQPGMNQTPDAASSGMTTPQQQASQDGSVLPNNIEEPDYRFVFNSCTVGMAIASMGGAFIDCNKLFSQLSSFSKQEVCSMTIFNFTAREDLQHAFDLISQMLSAPTDPNGNPATTSCVLRGSMKNRNDLGLSVSLIKGEDGVAKCFCVTLIRNPAHPFDTSRPIPATAELIQTPTSLDTTKPSGTDLDPTPRAAKASGLYSTAFSGFLYDIRFRHKLVASVLEPSFSFKPVGLKCFPVAQCQSHSPDFNWQRPCATSLLDYRVLLREQQAPRDCFDSEISRGLH